MKQREISSTTQAAILDAAGRIVLDKGADALTLEAVAQAAGISKGGLLYHFPSKRRLIEGMIERLIARMDAALDEQRAKCDGDNLKAFILAFYEEDPERDRISGALCAAIANDPGLLRPLQARYEVWQAQAAAAAATPATGVLIRLALDGLWVSDLLGLAPPSKSMRKKVLNRLISMTQEDK